MLVKMAQKLKQVKMAQALKHRNKLLQPYKKTVGWAMPIIHYNNFITMMGTAYPTAK